MPRSAIIWTRSRKLSLNVMYHLTHRMMISWSKCRPLNRSCAEVGSVIPAVIAGYRAFQQFAPEPWWTGGWRRSSICAGPNAVRRYCSTRAVRYSTANWANTPDGRLQNYRRCRPWRHEPPVSFRSRFKCNSLLHLNRGLPGSAVYDLSTMRHEEPNFDITTAARFP